MLSNLRSILSISFGVAVWGVTLGVAQAQFGGLQIQIGRSGGLYGGGPYGGGPYGIGPYGGSGLSVGGFNVPFGVGPSIPPSSRAYMGPQYQYQSGYRGYYGYGVPPSLGVYGSAQDYPTPTYRNYDWQAQQYQLQRQQLELQAGQRRLSAQQVYPYEAQSSYSVPQRASATSDLRPGMVLPDGSTVISVGPLSPVSSTPPPPSAPNSAVPPKPLPPGSPKPGKATF